ncbi:MAG TPA: porin family protein, partial [Solimonas sp.]
MGVFARSRWVSALGFGFAAALGAASIPTASAYTPGWYFGVDLFLSQLNDGDGTATVITPGTPGNPGDPGVDCLLPIDLLGVNLGLLGTCIIGGGTPGTPGNPDGPVVRENFPLSFSYDDGFGAGFKLGYLFDGGLRPEVNFSYNENDIKTFTVGGTSLDSSNSKLRAMRLMANVWYDIDFGSRVMPYVGAGFGFQNTEFSRQDVEADDTTTAYQLGAGVNFWANDRTALSLDYRFLVAQEPTFSSTDPTTNTRTSLKSEYENQQIGLSLRYAFGEGGGKDSDGDGVPDRLDKCPNTPKGVQVYSDGCPVADQDGDGIPDYLDKCPGTPPGVPVGA